MTVNILGTEYEVVESTPNDDNRLESAFAYVDWFAKVIVLDASSGSVSRGDMDVLEKKNLRHAMIYAFLVESGVYKCAGVTDEVMVDWFVFNGPKIYAAWQSVGAV